MGGRRLIAVTATPVTPSRTAARAPRVMVSTSYPRHIPYGGTLPQPAGHGPPNALPRQEGRSGKSEPCADAEVGRLRRARASRLAPRAGALVFARFRLCRVQPF